MQAFIQKKNTYETTRYRCVSLEILKAFNQHTLPFALARTAFWISSNRIKAFEIERGIVCVGNSINIRSTSGSSVMIKCLVTLATHSLTHTIFSAFFVIQSTPNKIWSTMTILFAVCEWKTDYVATFIRKPFHFCLDQNFCSCDTSFYFVCNGGLFHLSRFHHFTSNYFWWQWCESRSLVVALVHKYSSNACALIKYCMWQMFFRPIRIDANWNQ